MTKRKNIQFISYIIITTFILCIPVFALGSAKIRFSFRSESENYGRVEIKNGIFIMVPNADYGQVSLYWLLIKKEKHKIILLILSNRFIG